MKSSLTHYLCRLVIETNTRQVQYLLSVFSVKTYDRVSRDVLKWELMKKRSQKSILI